MGKFYDKNQGIIYETNGLIKIKTKSLFGCLNHASMCKIK